MVPLWSCSTVKWKTALTLLLWLTLWYFIDWRNVNALSHNHCTWSWIDPISGNINIQRCITVFSFLFFFLLQCCDGFFLLLHSYIFTHPDNKEQHWRSSESCLRLYDESTFNIPVCFNSVPLCWTVSLSELPGVIFSGGWRYEYFHFPATLYLHSCSLWRQVLCTTTFILQL